MPSGRSPRGRVGVTSFETEQTLLDDGLIAIVRGDFSVDEQERIAAASAAGGVRILEVTLNTTAALEGIRRLSERFAGDLLVGAWTADGAEAERAGAECRVSSLTNGVFYGSLDCGLEVVSRTKVCSVVPGTVSRRCAA